MTADQEMPRHLPRVEMLEQALIKGLAEIINRDLPTQEFDLFYIPFPIEPTSLVRAAPVLCEKFEGTIASEWVKISPQISGDEDMARNIAIRRFLSHQTILDIFSDVRDGRSFDYAANPGYRLTTRVSRGLGQDTLWIGLAPDLTVD